MELHNSIQAILFYQAEPMSIGKLAKLLKHSEGEVRDALLRLRENLTDSGLTLIENSDEVTLATSPAASSLIAAITKEELSKELSKASLETLAIVLYKGPLTRAEIDYIRGVNSNFILRNLQVRGLVEKIDNPSDQRSYLYKATFQLLECMGVSRKEELPEFATTMEALGAFVASKEAEEIEVATEKKTDEEAGTGLEEDVETLSQDSELDADIMDENDAGMAYDDAALHEEISDKENPTLI